VLWQAGTGQFRSPYVYSNIGITSAAEAAAKRAGQPWEDLVAERVFVPTGMKNTSAWFADFALADDHADTYLVTNGTAVAEPLLNDEVNSPAGGVSSTIEDMVRYARLQLNEGSIDGQQVVAAEALQRTRPRTSCDPPLPVWRHTLSAPSDPTPARSGAAYSGSYAQDYYGTVRVETNATGLQVYPGHSASPLFLVLYDGDTFRDTATGTPVIFTIGSDGAAESVRFVQFDLPGRNGTFVRTSP